MSAPAPPPGGGVGYNVVSEQLTQLADVFEQLEDTADGYQDRVDELTSVSGDHTGRCCPEAGDALRVGLQQVVSNLEAFGTHALDVRGAVQNTARNYANAEQTATDSLGAAGSGL